MHAGTGRGVCKGGGVFHGGDDRKNGKPYFRKSYSSKYPHAIAVEI